MGTTWAPTAHWLVVINGIPHNMGTRGAAIDAARLAHVPAYRQGVWPDRTISIVYDPATDRTYKAREVVVWQAEEET